MHGFDAVALAAISATWGVVWQILVTGIALLAAALLLYMTVSIASAAYFNALYRHTLKLDEHYKGKVPHGL